MRASALTLASKCRGSHKLNRGYGSNPSRLGNAFHELAYQKVMGLGIEWDQIETKYGMTESEMKEMHRSVYNLDINIPEGAIVFSGRTDGFYH